MDVDRVSVSAPRLTAVMAVAHPINIPPLSVPLREKWVLAVHRVVSSQCALGEQNRD